MSRNGRGIVVLPDQGELERRRAAPPEGNTLERERLLSEVQQMRKVRFFQFTQRDSFKLQLVST
jgi:hypothetical protein